jgi:hypothetical protein
MEDSKPFVVERERSRREISGGKREPKNVTLEGKGTVSV